MEFTAFFNRLKVKQQLNPSNELFNQILDEEAEKATKHLLQLNIDLFQEKLNLENHLNSAPKTPPEHQILISDRFSVRKFADFSAQIPEISFSQESISAAESCFLAKKEEVEAHNRKIDLMNRQITAKIEAEKVKFHQIRSEMLEKGVKISQKQANGALLFSGFKFDENEFKCSKNGYQEYLQYIIEQIRKIERSE